MVAYKREKLVFVHRSLGSLERKYNGENIILHGRIMAAGGKQTMRGGIRNRKEKEFKLSIFGEDVTVSYIFICSCLLPPIP